jgi:hypothetical protein
MVASKPAERLIRPRSRHSTKCRLNVLLKGALISKSLRSMEKLPPSLYYNPI